MPQLFRPHECPPDMLLGHALSCYKYLHESRMHMLQCSLSQCAARRTRHRAFHFGGGRQVRKLKKRATKILKQLQKSDGRQVGERKKQLKIHPKTYRNH